MLVPLSDAKAHKNNSLKTFIKVIIYVVPILSQQKLFNVENLYQGVQLPAKFYSELCNMLPTQNMISELVEVLLYVSLIPCLKVPLRGLADVLMCSEKTLTSPHSNAVFTGQVMNIFQSKL